MKLPEVEAAVHAAADGGGLAVALRRTRDGYVEAELRTPSDRGSGRSALLFTNGAEAFHLRLDDRFYLREFEYEPSEQEPVLRTLVGVAGAHLRGESVPAHERRWLRRDRQCLDIRWANDVYRARE